MTTPKDWRHKYGVYFIADGDSHVKIGHAHDPVQRLRALQTANRRAFTLLAVAVGESLAKEHEYHLRFSNQRVTGEWFKINRDIAAEIERVQRAYLNLEAPPIPRHGFGWYARVEG